MAGVSSSVTSQGIAECARLREGCHPLTGHETNANQAGEVAHLSALNRIDLRTALGGSEPEVMTPAILSHIEILNEQVLCRFDADSVEAEVNILGLSLIHI